MVLTENLDFVPRDHVMQRAYSKTNTEGPIIIIHFKEKGKFFLYTCQLINITASPHLAMYPYLLTMKAAASQQIEIQ